jgi:hypothetical protein
MSCLFPEYPRAEFVMMINRTTALMRHGMFMLWKRRRIKWIGLMPQVPFELLAVKPLEYTQTFVYYAV